MKHFEKKLNEFIDSIPPEFHAIHEKAEQLRKEFEIIKDMPETAINLACFYEQTDRSNSPSTWAENMAKKHYEELHYKFKGIKI